MATITPTIDSIATNISRFRWQDFNTTDTEVGVLVSGATGVIGCMQVSGTFGGATVTLQGSTDNSDFRTLLDLSGNPITFTSAGIRDFSTAAPYVRPIATGGTGDNVSVTIIVQG